MVNQPPIDGCYNHDTGYIHKSLNAYIAHPNNRLNDVIKFLPFSRTLVANDDHDNDNANFFFLIFAVTLSHDFDRLWYFLNIVHAFPMTMAHNGQCCESLFDTPFDSFTKNKIVHRKSVLFCVRAFNQQIAIAYISFEIVLVVQIPWKRKFSTDRKRS